MSLSVPIISADGDAAKIAAVAVGLFGEKEAERIARQREAQARKAGDAVLVRAWERIAEEIVKLKLH
jgi:hypothetical protein